MAAGVGGAERGGLGMGRGPLPHRHLFALPSYGFVEFEDSRDADDAVYELNGKDLCGERVIVEHARGPRRDRDGYSYSSRSESEPVPPLGAAAGRPGGGQGSVGSEPRDWVRRVISRGYPVHRWGCSVIPAPAAPSGILEQFWLPNRGLLERAYSVDNRSSIHGSVEM